MRAWRAGEPATRKTTGLHSTTQREHNAASKHADFDWAAFLPAVQNMATYEGKLSGIPYRVTTGILFYQKKLLEEAGIAKAPTNFAELLAAAEATTKQG